MRKPYWIISIIILALSLFTFFTINPILGFAIFILGFVGLQLYDEKKSGKYGKQSFDEYWGKFYIKK